MHEFRPRGPKRRFDPAFVAPVAVLLLVLGFALVGAIATGSWLGVRLAEWLS